MLQIGSQNPIDNSQLPLTGTLHTWIWSWHPSEGSLNHPLIFYNYLGLSVALYNFDANFAHHQKRFFFLWKQFALLVLGKIL